jgi:hypothetical protein
MIGRQDARSVEFDGRTNQLTFNLARPIEFGDSKIHAGVQIADVLASAAAYALKTPESDFAKALWKNFPGLLHVNSVFPDVAEFELLTHRSITNAVILQILVDRSARAESLITDVRGTLELAAFTAAEHMRERLASDVD